jgi:thioredoxin 1
MSAYMPASGPEPTREQIDQSTGLRVVEFGASWCPHCQAVQPELERLLKAHPEIDHVKVEDGKGKPLGRSFRVKLWPTLVFLRDGREVTTIVRPTDAEMQQAFAALTAST